MQTGHTVRDGGDDCRQNLQSKFAPKNHHGWNIAESLHTRFCCRCRFCKILKNFPFKFTRPNVKMYKLESYIFKLVMLPFQSCILIIFLTSMKYCFMMKYAYICKHL